MSDFLALDTLVLDPRFNGPPGTANGGYASGAVGELVDGPAEVTLLSPPPLGTPLGLSYESDGRVEVTGHHGVTVARAQPIDGVDAEPPQRRPGLSTTVIELDAGVPNRDGVVAAEVVWEVLSGSSPRPGGSVLARLAVERLDVVCVGEPVVAVGWHLASEGRKHHTASALLSANGDVLARARALWITLRSPR